MAFFLKVNILSTVILINFFTLGLFLNQGFFVAANTGDPECLGLSAFPNRGGSTLNVTFTGSGSDKDGKLTAFEFNFGDGQKETVEKDVGELGSQTANHLYVLPGTYEASVRVRNNDGQWSQVDEKCKLKIQVEGEVLAVPVQPGTGINTLLTFGFLAVGGVGAAIKFFLI